MESATRLFFWTLCLCLVACASTPHYKLGLKQLERNNTIAALKQFELDAEAGYRVPALFASSLHLDGTQKPIDVEQSKYYLELARKANYGRYDQRYDFWIPILQAAQIIFDEQTPDKSAAIDILSSETYQEFGWALYLLARMNLAGLGLEKNVEQGAALLESAAQNRMLRESGYALAWVYAVYPDERVRSPERALSLIESSTDMGHHPMYQNIHAAALASNGQYDEAIAMQSAAIEQLKKAVQHYPYMATYQAAFEARLKAYKRQEAWILTQQDIDGCRYDLVRCLPGQVNQNTVEPYFMATSLLPIHEHYFPEQDAIETASFAKLPEVPFIKPRFN